MQKEVLKKWDELVNAEVSGGTFHGWVAYQEKRKENPQDIANEDNGDGMRSVVSASPLLFSKLCRNCELQSLPFQPE